MDRNESFGAWLKKRRKALDLTQRELADRIGCAVITLQKIEAGERRPSEQIAVLLASHLGIAPEDSPPFVRFARSLAGLSLDSPYSAWRSGACRFANLPAPSFPSVGRDRDMAAVRGHLLNDPSRLLTLVGPPGVGKTHLAIQVAAGLSVNYSEGVCFVGLAHVGRANMVPTAIAAALGVNETPGQSFSDSLRVYLAEKHLLLVLDNFEQVIAAASLAGELLDACAWLTILVTSRVPLHIRRERQFVVLPLAAPRREQLTLEPAELLRYPAVALFVERSRTASPDFALTAENASAIGALCARLDGLPLAIELVAARSSVFSPRTLLQRLDPQLLLHTEGGRDASARHRTMHDAVGWSYALLAPEERRLLKTMSVFVDGWTLEAAESMTDEGRDVEGMRSAADALTSLVDGHLVQRQMRGSALRFTLLDTIRAYALERLAECGEEASGWRRHAAYFLALAEEADPHLRTADQRRWLDRLEAESGNLRAALSWYFDVTGDAASGLRMAAALSWFWVMRGHLSEAWEWLTKALAHRDSPRSELEVAIARSLLGAASIAWARGDLGTARALLEEGVARCRRLGPGQAGMLGWVLTGLAMVAAFQIDLDRAHAAAEESHALARGLGDKWLLALALNPLAEVRMLRHEYAAARTLLDESLALFRAIGDQWGMAIPLLNAGYLDALVGNLDAARAQLEESNALCLDVGERDTRTRVLDVLAGVAQQQGDLEAAVALYQQSLDLLRQMGGLEELRADTGYNLARLAEAQGYHPLARKLFGECLALYSNQGNQQAVDRCRVELAALTAAVMEERKE